MANGAAAVAAAAAKALRMNMTTTGLAFGNDGLDTASV